MANRVGSVSLAAAVTGVVACRVGHVVGPFAGAAWLGLLGAGFEAAVVGGLADWFAVTALFRHPLGLPIPHTAIIPTRRAKIIDSIVTMVEEDWLSPDVIGARLRRLTPSELIVDWLRDPVHVDRLGAPVRDLLGALARLLTGEELVVFVDRALRRQLRELPIDAATGRWIARAVQSDAAGTAFESLAGSLARLAAQPRTAGRLHWWLERSARTLQESGKRFVPFVLRRKVVKRKLVEAACDYAATELQHAAGDPEHPLRRQVLGGLARFAERLAEGEPAALEQAERIRAAVLESLEAAPLVRDTLARLRAQIEEDLDDPASALSRLIDRELRSGIVELLDDPARRSAFDDWVRTTADDLLRRHHDQIGLTVRENLEALKTDALVARIEERVGDDLQFIRLNGAVVGGLVGLALAALRWATG